MSQDSTISKLPAASTLTGSEIVPIDQGATKQTTASQIAALSNASIAAETAARIAADNVEAATRAAADTAITTNLAASSGSSLVGFIAAGTGAISRTLQNKDRDIVSVKDYGAVGDGVTDDTNAIILAGNALQAAGGGTLLFPKGNYFIYKNGVTYTQAPVTLSSITGVVIDFSAATITLDPAKSWTGSNANFISCTNCNDVTVIGGNVTGPTIALDGTFTGVVIVHMSGDNEGLCIPYMRVNKAFAPLIMDGPVSTGTTNVWIGTLDVTGCIYGINGQFAGKNVVIENLVTSGCGRSLFLYGYSHVRANVRSTNPQFSADVSCSTVTGAALTEDWEIYYTNLDSTSASTGVGVMIQFSQDEVTPGTINDIRVHLNVRYGGSGQIGSSLLVSKILSNGNPDTVDRGNVLKGLVVTGLVDGHASSGSPVQLGNTGSVWGVGENVFDVTFRDLKVVNNTTDNASLDLKLLTPSLKGALTLDNVQVPKAIDVFGGSSPASFASVSTGARFFVTNVSCTNLDDYAIASLVGLRVIQANASPVTVLNIYREHKITNFGASGTVLYNLPAALVGMEYSFARVVAQAMHMVPNGSEIIQGGGAGKYMSLDSDGASVTLYCYITGTWSVYRVNGTTSFQP